MSCIRKATSAEVNLGERNQLWIEIDDVVSSALSAYLASCDARPAKSSVGVKALREFLAKRGFLAAAQ